MNKFFILGCPRSGTTMVQQALNRHSQIAIPAETKFFFSFLGQPKKYQLRHIERLNADLNIHLPPPVKRIASDAEGRDYYELMARHYLDGLCKPTVTCFGEKSPEHTGLLPRIRRMFPEAKFLVLYRDGRDVASSLSRMPWMTPNLYVNFVVWLYYYWVLLRERERNPDNLYFARYEDIVADPRSELARILDFLGLPYEATVTEGHGNSEGVPLREYAWKRRALERIGTARVGVFQHELSMDEIEVLERLGKEPLSALGYSLITDGTRRLPLTLLMKLTLDLTRFAIRLPRCSVLRELACRLSPDGKPTPSLATPVVPAPA